MILQSPIDSYSAAHAFVACDCWHVFEHVKYMCYGTAIVVIANVCHSVVLVLFSIMRSS